jgi:nitrate/nitrite-specific signal transduction histidine kinase
VHLHEQLMQVRENLAQRVDDHNALLRRVAELRRENETVVRRFTEIESQNANLANLYVASCQLHASLDRREVIAAIREIVVTHIGSQEFAIYERRGADRLRMIESSEGAPPAFRDVVFGDGIIGKVAASGEPFISNGDHGRAYGIAACVPFEVNGRVTGAIAIFRLDPRKEVGLEALDEELLGLLSSQAGIALHCTDLDCAAREGSVR